MPRGVPTRAFDRGGSPAQAALLEAQLRRLRSMEAGSEVYREMLAAADESVAAGTYGDPQVGRLQRRHQPEGGGVSIIDDLVAELGDTSRHIADEDPPKCCNCKAEKPDLVGLNLVEAEELEAEDFGFCSIPCLIAFVQNRWSAFA